MPPDHGTRACYRAGCRCLTCRAANATYQQARRTSRATGRLTAQCRVDARPVWDAVRWLLREGYSRSALARLLGRRTRELNIGRRWVTAGTAARLLGLYRHHRGEDVGTGHKM